MQWTVPSAAPKQQSQSANPNQLKTERLENNLRRCGENWLTKLMFSFLKEMTKVHSSSQRSTLAHKSSALKIEETAWKTCVQTCFSWKRTNILPLLPLPPRLFCRLTSRGAFFCGFPFRWVLHVVRSVDSQHNRAWRNTWHQGEFSIWMWAPMRCIVLPLLYCPMAPAMPVFIGTGGPTSEGLWYDLSQDVPDQSHHMLTSGAHVLGVASGSVCKIRPFQIFALSWGSQRRPTTRRSSSFHTVPLETEYSSSTSADITAHYRLGWVWPFPFRRHAMYNLEYSGPSPDKENREWKLNYLKKTVGLQQHLSPRSAWKERISSGHSGAFTAISFFGTFIADNENAGGSAICIHRDDAFDYLSWSRSLC